MKRVLITGADSYIGTSFERYVKENYPNDFEVDTVDMLDGSWRNRDFSGYDVVYHVAGLAHSDVGEASEETKKLYYKINTDLTIETAQKAKNDGVKQFIFMSSAIVYGSPAPLGKKKIVDQNTAPNPANFYGDSKLQAEKGILPLNDDSFKVVVLRPPMIYGKGSKGNYPILAKLARKAPIFPYVKNARSALYVGNLVEFVRLMIVNNESGVFHPQNEEYYNTSELVKLIAEANKRRVRLIKGFGWVLRILRLSTPLVDKAFGSFCYARELSDYKANYRKYSLERSILATEKEGAL